VATWAEFEAARPEMASRGRDLMLIEQPDAPGPAGLAYLATVRADGRPRIHPISPALLDGHLYAYVLRNTHKNADLRRDGRYALHSWPKPFTDDGFDDEELMLAGRAVAVTDLRLHERVSSAVGDRPESGESYELLIEGAFHKSRADGRPIHATWSAP
jgi:hypothetical protein